MKALILNFLIKQVLKKADMIRKNAVESILAERDILISVRNPFVVSRCSKSQISDYMVYLFHSVFNQQVRFYYSFTCRENLYLVMEYLNGGDLYSLLRNLGCLDEEMARTYIAELVRRWLLAYILCFSIFSWVKYWNKNKIDTDICVACIYFRCLHWSTCIRWMSFIEIWSQTTYYLVVMVILRSVAIADALSFLFIFMINS